MSTGAGAWEEREGADYTGIQLILRMKLDRDRAAGHPRDVLASVDEQVLLEHDTAAKQRGAPCDTCGNPWPCPTVLSVLAPE